MPEFTIIDERRHPLEVNQYSNIDTLPYYRFEHRVTVGYRGRRLMAFIDQLRGKVYIEEITGGNIKTIEDELFEAIYIWVEANGYWGVWPPMMKPRG